MSDAVFDAYAGYYDLLYRDKDYDAEVRYLHRLISEGGGRGVCDLLELGCGTGRHAVRLAELGYRVLGIDRSPGMLASAQELRERQPSGLADRLQFESGDVRDWRSARRFPVVLSLFHVLSYQSTDADIRNMLATVAAQLQPGGLFIADFWYGPAVVAQHPEVRTKVFEDDRLWLQRHAEPQSFPDQHRVDVHYRMHWRHKAGIGSGEFEETHRMRYFFDTGLRDLLTEAGLEALRFEEWLTGAAASDASWSVVLLARRRP